MRAHRSAAACRVVRPLGLPAGGHLATGIFERNFPVNSRWIRFFRMAVLLLILWSGGLVANQAATRAMKRSFSAETEYWHELHEKQQREQSKEEEQRQQKREEIRNSVAEIVEAGEAMNPVVLAARAEPAPPPPPPSIWKGKGNYILLSLQFLFISALTAVVMVRHKREAEIRALNGGYLSDEIFYVRQ